MIERTISTGWNADFSSLVDEITFKKASESADSVTQTAILGPFFRHDAPLRENGSTITFNTPEDGQVVYMHGVVTDAKTKKPLKNASVDVWQASTNGISGLAWETRRFWLIIVQVCMNNRMRTR